MNRTASVCRLAVVAGLSLGLCTVTFAQDEGKDVYLDKCAVCHGQDGQGKTAKGRKLKVKSVSNTIKTEDEAAMIKVVTDGKDPDMDAFKGELSAAQIKAVTDYYRSLAK